MKRALLCLAVLPGLPCARAGAYVDPMSGFTLGYVMEHSPTIVVLQVEKVSLESGKAIPELTEDEEPE